MGTLDEALAAYEAGDAADPATNGLQRAASLASRLGRPSYARRIYRNLCHRDPEGPICDKLAQPARGGGGAPAGGGLP